MEHLKATLIRLPTCGHLMLIAVSAIICISMVATDMPKFAFAAQQPIMDGESYEETRAYSIVDADDGIGLLNDEPAIGSGIAKEVGMELPNIEDTSVKTYMDYKTITAVGSPQWQLQQYAHTNEYGFRELDGRYMIALGTFYSDHAGGLFHITLENGTEFDAITGDVKANRDTDAKNQHRRGNVIEFIVDTPRMANDAMAMGDVSYTPGAGLMGNVASIEYQGEFF